MTIPKGIVNNSSKVVERYNYYWIPPIRQQKSYHTPKDLVTALYRTLYLEPDQVCRWKRYILLLIINEDLKPILYSVKTTFNRCPFSSDDIERLFWTSGMIVNSCYILRQRCWPLFTFLPTMGRISHAWGFAFCLPLCLFSWPRTFKVFDRGEVLSTFAPGSLFHELYVPL